MSNENYELLSDICATVSILIKFGHDDMLEDKTLFIAFLNELGFRLAGKKITSERLFEMTQSITTREKKLIFDEFNKGHEPIYRKLAMHNVLA